MIKNKTVILVALVPFILVTVWACTSETQVAFESLTCDHLTDHWTGHKWKDNFARNNEILSIKVLQRLDRVKGELEGIGCDSEATLKYGLTKRELKNHSEEIILQAWKQADGKVKHEFAFCYLWPCEQVFEER
tara:strand:- start:10762 stop:11160 length:399 start_codon:yes stop_codon:yes gene_type:complete